MKRIYLVPLMVLGFFQEKLITNAFLQDANLMLGKSTFHNFHGGKQQKKETQTQNLLGGKYRRSDSKCFSLNIGQFQGSLDRKHHKALSKALRNMKEEDFLKGDPDLQDKVVQTAAKKRLKSHACRLLQAMLKSGSIVDLLTWQEVLLCCREKGSLEETMQIFHQMQQHYKPNLVTVNTVIAAQVGKGKLQEGYKMLLSMKEKYQLVPDMYSYNTVISGASKKGREDIVENCMELMETSGLEPNVYTLNNLMNNEIRKRKPTEALRILNKMMAGEYKGVEPNPISFAIGVNAHTKNSDINGAKKLIQEMKKGNVMASADHYNNILSFYMEKRKWKRALNIYHAEMVGRNAAVRPNVVTYNILLKGLTHVPTIGLDIYKDMLALRLRPVSTTVMSLLKFQDSPAGVFKVLEECHSKWYPINLKVLNTAISCLGKLEDPLGACRVFESIPKAGFIPDYVSYNSLIGAFSEKESIDKGPFAESNTNQSVIQSMWQNLSQTVSKTPMKPSFKTKEWYEYLKTGPSSSDNALEIQYQKMDGLSVCLDLYTNKMNQSGIFPTERTISILMGAIVRLGGAEPDQSSKLCKSIYEHALSVGINANNGFIYNALLRSFHQNVEESIEFWKNTVRPSLGNGVLSPDQKVFQANLKAAYQGLLSNCGKAGRADLALKVIYAMKKDGLTTDPSTLRVFYSSLNGQQLGIMQRSFEKVLQVECNNFGADISKIAGMVPYEKIRIRY